MIILRTDINVGAQLPFSVIHMSDTHFTLADDRDGVRKTGLAGRRATVFPNSKILYDEGCRLSKELGCPILHTGDFIDFVSHANLEMVKRFTDENDVFYAAGNHDFSLYCGEETEDAAYRNRSLAAVQACHGNNIRMSSRIINGVNFVALDDGYYRFENEQVDFVRSEVSKGLPIVLMIHKALYDPEIFAFSERTHHTGALTGVPVELVNYWDDEKKSEVCPDEETSSAVRYFKSEPMIKAILSGHFHNDYDGTDESGRRIILTGFETLRIITFC